MRSFAPVLVFALLGSPVLANERIDRLAQAMHLSDVMEVLVLEGQLHRQNLDETLLNNSGGAYFEAQVNDIYEPLWMQDHLTDALEVGMSDAQLDQAIVFFESDLGQTVVTLENSARQAMSDPAIEDMARDAFEATERTTIRFALVEEYIEANDLVEKNVQGSLTSDYNFFRGLDVESRADTQDLLAELLSQKESRAEDTEAWLYAFLLLAYRPLDETQMRENIAFSRTDTGQALNDALFEGFDRMFNDISYQLGQAVARALRASDL